MTRAVPSLRRPPGPRTSRSCTATSGTATSGTGTSGTGGGW